MSPLDPVAVIRAGRCGACRGALDGFLNLMILDRLATWKNPTAGNVLEPANTGRAVAVLCDGCAEAGKAPTEAIEIDEESGEIRYHAIEELPLWIPGPAGTA